MSVSASTIPAAPVIGRFAPSPSGPLHFGSLVAALGSYLSAKAQRGQWLLRIEDIDPPREPVGAADTIRKQLEAFALCWDGEVLYQSQRSERYEQVLAQWLASGAAFHCACTRRELQDNAGRCANHCAEKHLGGQRTAIRLRAPAKTLAINDRIHGLVAIAEHEDIVLKRRDGLYGYTLAVVVDDLDQGITEIVRGADLLTASPLQAQLFRLLGAQPPSYTHLPLVLQADGRKLSKQNQAPAISVEQRLELLHRALRVLGQPVPEAEHPEALLTTATTTWDIAKVPKGPVFELASN